MDNNPLIELSALGQSIWLDDIHRGMLTGGELRQLIEEDGVCGVTSNPAILKRAVAEHDDYIAQLSTLAPACHSTEAQYEALVLQDIRDAADLLRPVYERSDGRDGYVSLEVSPHLADDSVATVTEARRLWIAVDRPNIMIKVPATLAGLPAMSELLAEGVNVNATLIFSLQRYQEVAMAHVAGLERRLTHGGSIDGIASVASFFISRIDTLVDNKLDMLGQGSPGLGAQTQELRGQAAIATARLAYQHFQQHLLSQRWQVLQEAGGMPQRLLWASTSTKDPSFSDIKYVEALIGPNSVNTMPLETLHAYRQHGQPAVRIENELESDERILERLEEMGILMSEVAAQLEREGVDKFVAAYDELITVIAELAKSVS
jgi:transaldolase